MVSVGPSICTFCYVVAENHYPTSNLAINVGPRALLRIEGRLKGTGVKNRSSFETARSEESYAASSKAIIMFPSNSFFGRNRSGNNKSKQNVAELEVKANTCTSSLVFLSSCYLKAHLESRRPCEGSFFSVV